MKNIALFFDGTWNKPGNDTLSEKSDTNVCYLYRATPDIRDDAHGQETWYDQGVGTHWYDRIRGGLYGYGLDQNIQAGYAFLTSNYEENDQVYLFGFSRGAYSARSLAGWIRKCGLLWHAEKIDTAYALYRNRDIGVDDPAAAEFVAQYARRIPIHFMGVWDTVGALGLPLHALQWFNQAEYAFHDVELSGIVANAFQAVALDEFRAEYDACLWASVPKENQHIEQVWFAGAHADVGGGYAPDTGTTRLANVPLIWLAQKARECGLEITMASLPATSEDYLAVVHDSYHHFLEGLYAAFRPEHLRPLNLAPGSTQSIDETVERRIEAIPAYRPANPGMPAVTMPA